MVDAERVRTRLGRLEQCVRGLVEKQDCSRQEHRQDRDLRDVVERRFEKAIQACVDVGTHVTASEGFREPRDYGDVFRVLEEEGVLTGRTADEMVEMAGFRNVLVHEYAGIDDAIVHDHLQDLSRFRRFAEEIEAYLDG